MPSHANAACLGLHALFGLLSTGQWNTEAPLPPLPSWHRLDLARRRLRTEANVTTCLRLHNASAVEAAMADVLQTLRAGSSPDPATTFTAVWPQLPPVARSDMGRYALLYMHGGLYLDLDAEISPTGAVAVARAHQAHEVLLFTEKVAKIKDLGTRERERPHRQRIAQYALLAPRGAPFFRAVLIESFRRLATLLGETLRNDGDNLGASNLSRFKPLALRLTDKDVLWATGPDVVTAVALDSIWSDVTVVGTSESTSMVAHQERGSWRAGRRYARESNARPHTHANLERAPFANTRDFHTLATLLSGHRRYGFRPMPTALADGAIGPAVSSPHDGPAQGGVHWSMVNLRLATAAARKAWRHPLNKTGLRPRGSSRVLCAFGIALKKPPICCADSCGKWCVTAPPTHIRRICCAFPAHGPARRYSPTVLHGPAAAHVCQCGRDTSPARAADALGLAHHEAAHHLLGPTLNVVRSSGRGCDLRPGGATLCCAGTIKKQGRVCRIWDDVGCVLPDAVIPRLASYCGVVLTKTGAQVRIRPMERSAWWQQRAYGAGSSGCTTLFGDPGVEERQGDSVVLFKDLQMRALEARFAGFYRGGLALDGDSRSQRKAASNASMVSDPIESRNEFGAVASSTSITSSTLVQTAGDGRAACKIDLPIVVISMANNESQRRRERMYQGLRSVGCGNVRFKLCRAVTLEELQLWGVSSRLSERVRNVWSRLRRDWSAVTPSMTELSIVVSHLKAARMAIGLIRRTANQPHRAALILEDDVDFSSLRQWRNVRPSDHLPSLHHSARLTRDLARLACMHHASRAPR